LKNKKNETTRNKEGNMENKSENQRVEDVIGGEILKKNTTNTRDSKRDFFF